MKRQSTIQELKRNAVAAAAMIVAVLVFMALAHACGLVGA
jgi:hypothetical protein